MRLLKSMLPILLVMQVSSFAQNNNKGIHFEQLANWNDVVAKAQSLKKPIFVDCYTTWCGPCKYMEKQVFADEQVGRFFNEHFVCVRLQMDQAASDDSLVHGWYIDARKFEKEFRINSFPTFFFFDSSGEPIHRIAGAVKQPSDFIACGKNALEPSRQFYPSLKAVQSGQIKDSVQLLQLYHAATLAHDFEAQVAIGKLYLHSIIDPFNKDNIGMMALVRSVVGEHLTSDSMFLSETKKFLIENAKKINNAMADGKWVQRLLFVELYYQDVGAYLEKNKLPVDWDMIIGSLAFKYPTLNEETGALKYYYDWQLAGTIHGQVDHLAKKYKQDDINWQAIQVALHKEIINYPDLDRLILWAEADYCRDHELWKNGLSLSMKLIKRFGGKEYAEPNDLIWDFVFLHCNDRNTIDWAIKILSQWIEGKGHDEYQTLDTYANLLYKSGQKKPALEWQKKAIEMAIKKNVANRDIDELTSHQRKMENGIRTWVE